MSRSEVTVDATWRSTTTFEFDTEAEADEFRRLVKAGGVDGLNAIVEAGDVDTSGAELVDWEAWG